MTIKNYKGQIVGAEEVPAPVKKRGRPKKTEIIKNKIDPVLRIGAEFHEMFPCMLKYTENKITKSCYFQSQSYLEKHIIRHNLDRQTLIIGQTEPRN